MKYEVWKIGMVIVLALQGCSLVVSLLAGSDGWSNSWQRSFLHGAIALAVIWIVTGIVSFVICYRKDGKDES